MTFLDPWKGEYFTPFSSPGINKVLFSTCWPVTPTLSPLEKFSGYATATVSLQFLPGRNPSVVYWIPSIHVSLLEVRWELEKLIADEGNFLYLLKKTKIHSNYPTPAANCYAERCAFVCKIRVTKYERINYSRSFATSRMRCANQATGRNGYIPLSRRPLVRRPLFRKIAGTPGSLRRDVIV